ncbi:MAG: aspartate ammonia-lyase [Lachnospiraceae bacterium]|nr:aspartate ammonia-lyase [Lachnospiraceae bacterium]
MRIEHDFLGEMEIEDSAYYGIQTKRGLRYSAKSGHSFGQDAFVLIYNLAALKLAAAQSNCLSGGLTEKQCRAIIQACQEIMEGRFMDQFPTDLFTGGGGITVHMNVNEVIANRANEILTGHKGYDAIHPNTHVNMSQSTNDVLPCALLLSLNSLLEDLASSTKAAANITDKKAEEFKDVVKIGRTCLQDAVPITLGQEFSGYASALHRQVTLLQELADACLVLPIGATAVGTGVGLQPGYILQAENCLSNILHKDIRVTKNYFDAFQNSDIYTRISCALKTLAGVLSKMATDLRLMSSGPRAGFHEINLPRLLPGSSIMPGKINPILPELVIQVCFQINGNDTAISMAVDNCDLDLNVWEAVMTKCLFESCTLLSRSLDVFARECVAGITANVDVCREYAENSTAISAIVSAVWGYETGSSVAREAVEKDMTIYEVVVSRGLLNEEQARELLDPLTLVDPVKNQKNIAKYQRLLGFA